MSNAHVGAYISNILAEASSVLCMWQNYVGARLSRHRPTVSSTTPDATQLNEQQHVRHAQQSVVDNSVCLRDLELQHLPKDWRERLCGGHAVDGRGMSHWKVSYVSAESFFENKHGFAPNLLPSARARSTHPHFLFSTSVGVNRLHSKSCTRPFHSFIHHRQQYRSMAQVARGILINLERLANRHPGDADIQATYLQAVVREDPLYVIRRYESGRYSSSEECARIYQKAKKLSSIIHSSSTASLSRDYEEHQSGGEKLSGSSGDLGTENKPVYVVQQSNKGSFFWTQLFNTLKYVVGLIILVSVFDAAFQMRGMTTNHKAVLPDRSDRKYRFDDVQGVDEAKEELQEVVEFLRSPDKFRRLGGKLPKGLLLIGPPGTGKTLLARAVAGEAGVPFFFCSGSEFDEMFVGVGAARVRNLFTAAKEHAPCIVFMDELDAIGGRRVKNDVQPYSRMTLNQLLVEMDGFEQNSGVVVIGATNFPEVLDEALVRPGRFDSKVIITMPDVKARYDILKVHVKDVPLAKDVDLEVLARGTSGMTGADLAGLINQAAVHSSALGHDDITMVELEWAKDKILMGPERKSAVIDEQQKRVVAFHEAGHALVAIHTDGAFPVHKATIMPRGPALGMVAQLPEKDQLLLSRRQLLAKMDVAMAGRVAEELIFGSDNVTTGASSDFEQATAVARGMVSQFGMSDKVGPVLHKLESQSDISPETRHVIEAEVKRLLQESYERAVGVLKKHHSQHRLLAEALLKYETLTSDEIKAVIAGRTIDRKL